jgi:hypothetical protein
MAAAGSLLYGNFGAGAGIWKWNGTTWSQITPNAPTAIAASDTLLYGNFGEGAGIWEWNGTTWSQITPNAPTAMAAAGSLLYGNFGTGAGIWKYDGSTWSQVTPNAPTVMVAEGSLLYGNFGAGAGIWKYDGSTWSQVTPNNPINMVFWSTPVVGATDYFPLNIGDWQDYKISGSGSIVHSTVTGPRNIGGVATKERNYWDGTKEYYTSDVNGIILYGQYVISANFTGDIYFNTPLLLMPNNAQIGTTQVSGSSYAFSVQGYVYNVNITSTTTVLNFEDVQTEHMILRDCVKVSIRIDQYIVELSQSISSTVYYWFYKGVGCVKQQVGSTTYTITGSYVNGVQHTY